MQPYLKYLPNERLKDKFAKSVIHEIETNAKELQWKLDFVRLNINAKKIWTGQINMKSMLIILMLPSIVYNNLST